MENIVQKISEELENNPELNEDINDIGLPKSSLHSFVKEFLTKNKVRGDKNIIPFSDISQNTINGTKDNKEKQITNEKD